MTAPSLASPPEKCTGDTLPRREGEWKPSHRDLTWRKCSDGLHCTGRRGAIVTVVPDATYPQMWRIRYSDGRLSDMVNLSRAKDAAVAQSGMKTAGGA
jgi:hypothetical protein